MRTFTAALGGLGLLILYLGLTQGREGARSGGVLLKSIDNLVSESGMTNLSGTRLIVLAAASGVLTLVFIAGLSSSLVIATAFALATAWTPFGVARARRNRRRRRFREAWPDAIASLIAGVRAGMSLPETCASLAERGPKDLRPGFSAFTATYHSAGSFRAGLQRLQGHLSDPVADRVVAALVIAHDVGGTELVRVLRTLGNFVREDLRVRKEIEASWSWTVTAARVACAAPWVVLLLMSTRPEAAAAYNSSSGIAVIFTGAIATIIGYRLMLRAARLPEERRLSR